MARGERAPINELKVQKSHKTVQKMTKPRDCGNFPALKLDFRSAGQTEFLPLAI